jgi:hypothetical protein
MRMNNLCKKKVAIIVVAVFLLTLCALDLNALLLQGKGDVSQAQAVTTLKIFRGHTVTIRDPQGNVIGYDCVPSGFSCAIIVIGNDQLIITFPWAS